MRSLILEHWEEATALPTDSTMPALSQAEQQQHLRPISFLRPASSGLADRLSASAPSVALRASIATARPADRMLQVFRLSFRKLQPSTRTGKISVVSERSGNALARFTKTGR